MSYTFNQEFLLIENLNREEELKLVSFASSIVLEGKIDFENEFAKFWLDNVAHTNDQKLLLYSTAMPQRLLLSVIRNEGKF